MKRILVTGINGFVGKHLAKDLLDNGFEVVGIGGRNKSDQNIDSRITSVKSLDLNDISEVEAIDFKSIDKVIHLAGLASNADSFNNVREYINTNMGAEANLFETAIKQGYSPRFLIISSGSLYRSDQDMPLTEKSLELPSSPYAVSKMGQEQLARYYTLRGFECVIVRPFNHFGPGQNTGFLVPDLVEQVLNVSLGKAESINVGDLSTKRDFTDVRDIVRAYRLLLNTGRSGEVYNVCSGKSLSGQDILDIVQSELNCKPTVNVDQSRIRPSDPPLIVGSAEKLTNETGWKPEIDLKETVKGVISDFTSRN